MDENKPGYVVKLEEVLTVETVAEVIKHLVISGVFAEEAERYKTERDHAVAVSMSYAEEAEKLAEVDSRVVARLLMAFGLEEE